MLLDGSDIGLLGEDIDAFSVLDDGSLLLSTWSSATIDGVGVVDDSDIVRFIPTSLGGATSGTFELYFDGSDVSLTQSGEDIDAIQVLADGSLVLSTSGSFSVTGLNGRDEDLLHFIPTSLGNSTQGSWQAYFDGSDVGLNSSSSEDIHGLSIADNDIYLTTRGSFSVAGVSGDANDVFICTPLSLGTSTECSFRDYWLGLDLADESIDALAITDGHIQVQGVTASSAAGSSMEGGSTVGNGTEGNLNDDADDGTHVTEQLFLPFIKNK